VSDEVMSGGARGAQLVRRAPEQGCSPADIPACIYNPTEPMTPYSM
jgi:hypothetical protein